MKKFTDQWQLYTPTFEFTKDLPLESSAWSGHYNFAYDLVTNTKPSVIVELGTHKGNSLFSFAQAIKDFNLDTQLHAVDTWKGDEQAGFYGEEVYNEFLEIKDRYYKEVNIIPHRMLFDEALNKFENNSIDILHIDGLHTYEAVKHDFGNWLPKVKKDTGIILFHDVCEKSDDFGVYKLWEELKKKYKTITFEHYHGLGVVFLKETFFSEELLSSELITNYYAKVSKNHDLRKEIKDKEIHIKNINEKKKKLLKERNKLKEENTEIKAEKEKLLKEKNKVTRESTKIRSGEEKLLEEKDKLTKENAEIKAEKEKLLKERKKLRKENTDIKLEKEKLEKECQELRQDAQEFRIFKQTKIWKALTAYRKFKKYFKNFFINIFRDGPILTLKRIFKRIENTVQYRVNLEKERDPYKYWVKQNGITWQKRIRISSELKTLEYKPLISIVMPVYNVDVKWIKEAIKSIRNQIYPNWELCMADDASTNPELIKYLKSLKRDSKIKITFRKKNGHISEASNTALELAEGEFVALMDNDDIIHPHALAEVVKVLNKNKDTDFIYSDEDKIDMEGKRVEPFFKPDWSPDLFMSTNYLCHLTVIRKKLIDEVNGFRKGYEGSQDYDLFLRITELTNKIEHIPDVLYSWRKIPGSTASTYSQKSYADKASLTALSEAIERRGLNATVQKGLFPGSFRVKYNIEGNPLVSILIPTKDKYKYIKNCISSIFSKTIYQNFEVIIIDTGSTEKRTLKYYNTLKSNPKIRFLHWDKRFNYSAVNNFGVKHAKGDYILLLNNDTEVITPNWIEGMLEHAQRKEIGAVGAKLLYPNNTIQHAGIILGIGGSSKEGSIAGHVMNGFSSQVAGIPLTKDVVRNYSAVTAACLMISKEKYKEVGGMKEKFRIAFNDVDFNLELRKLGYYNVYTPYVELYHHESVSVGRIGDGTREIREFEQEVTMMQKIWGEVLSNDPFYNRNLRWENTNFEIKV